MSSPGHPAAAPLTAKPLLPVAYRATGKVRAKSSSWRMKAHFCALGATERRRLAAQETSGGRRRSPVQMRSRCTLRKTRVEAIPQ